MQIGKPCLNYRNPMLESILLVLIRIGILTVDGIHVLFWNLFNSWNEWNSILSISLCPMVG